MQDFSALLRSGCIETLRTTTLEKMNAKDNMPNNLAFTDFFLFGMALNP